MSETRPIVDAIPTRRDFCVRTCQALSALTASSWLAACGGGPTAPSNAPALPTVAGTLTNGAVTVTIDAASPLATTGGAALVQASGSSFLVSRTGQDTFSAVTAICTHEGCTVTGFENQRYVCPCHGSQFTTSGAVVQGPASSPLRQFATRFANNVLTITS